MDYDSLIYDSLKFSAEFLCILQIISDPQKKKVQNVDCQNVDFIYSKIIETDKKSLIPNNYFEYLNNRRLIKIQYIFDNYMIRKSRKYDRIKNDNMNINNSDFNTI